MPPEQTIRDRIKLGCIHLGVKQQDLAVKIGVSKQEIAHVGAGRYRSGRVVEGIARALGATVEWMLNGEGPAPAWAQQVRADAGPEDHSTSERLRRAETVVDALVKRLDGIQDENEQLRALVADLKKQLREKTG